MICVSGWSHSFGRLLIAVVSSRELDEQAGPAGASGRSSRIPNGTDEAGDGAGGDRSCHRSRCALWLRVGGCRLWVERAVPRHLKVYPADVRMIWPVAKRGRPRQRHVPDILSIPAEDMLANATWRTISWRTGTKGKLTARFSAVRVRVADGPPQRIRDKGQQHLPGGEARLIGEHRMSGEKKYYLANLPAKTDLRTLAATIKARWICEQAHQQMKEELGLDHFEGRSWQAFTVMRL